MVISKWLWNFTSRSLHRILGNNVKKTPFIFIAGVLVGTGAKEIFDKYTVPTVTARSELPSSDQSSSVDHVFEKYGSPNHLLTLHYSNHLLQYDFNKRIPLWVAEHITKDTLYGSADRATCTFKQDNNIPIKFRSRNEDYLNSGFTRGHMMPAADNKSNQFAMNETFYLSNILPQDSENNKGFWFRMETYCRSLANKYSDVYVISGPLFIPQPSGGSNDKVVTYKVIGDNHVAVPSHLYKVVLAENNGKPVSLAAFVVPNTLMSDAITLKEKQVPLDELERLAGIEFFPKLHRKQVRDLCDGEGCKMLSKKAADLWRLSKSVKYAKSVEELDKAFADVNKKKIQVDKKFMDSYWAKKKELKGG